MFKFNKKAEKSKNEVVDAMELEEDNLSNVSGGAVALEIQRVGGPIYANCAKCGKSFKAGNEGVNHVKYPLATVCPECSSKEN